MEKIRKKGKAKMHAKVEKVDGKAGRTLDGTMGRRTRITITNTTRAKAKEEERESIALDKHGGAKLHTKKVADTQADKYSE